MLIVISKICEDFGQLVYNQKMSEYAHFYTQVYVLLLFIFSSFLFLYKINDFFFQDNCVECWACSVRFCLW